MRKTALWLAVVYAVLLGSPLDAAAKPATHKRVPLKPQPASDVAVTKNSDGTVEVTNAVSSPTAKPGVTYRPAPPATIRYGDGVIVRRNADGSVDVSDEDSAHPVMRSLGDAPSSVHHATTHGAHRTTHAATGKKK